mgnify:CR=1 FL=1
MRRDAATTASASTPVSIPNPFSSESGPQSRVAGSARARREQPRALRPSCRTYDAALEARVDVRERMPACRGSGDLLMGTRVMATASTTSDLAGMTTPIVSLRATSSAPMSIGAAEQLDDAFHGACPS